ncbi:hypothetical protein DIPPA_22677 [Diplonema papillatum]|nr:hypothetical protein DIPPA_22677 [Diplonema papillatum]
MYAPPGAQYTLPFAAQPHHDAEYARDPPVRNAAPPPRNDAAPRSFGGSLRRAFETLCCLRDTESREGSLDLEQPPAEPGYDYHAPYYSEQEVSDGEASYLPEAYDPEDNEMEIATVLALVGAVVAWEWRDQERRMERLLHTQEQLRQSMEDRRSELNIAHHDLAKAVAGNTLVLNHLVTGAEREVNLVPMHERIQRASSALQLRRHLEKTGRFGASKLATAVPLTQKLRLAAWDRSDYEQFEEHTLEVPECVSGLVMPRFEQVPEAGHYGGADQAQGTNVQFATAARLTPVGIRPATKPQPPEAPNSPLSLLSSPTSSSILPTKKGNVRFDMVERSGLSEPTGTSEARVGLRLIVRHRSWDAERAAVLQKRTARKSNLERQKKVWEERESVEADRLRGDAAAAGGGSGGGEGADGRPASGSGGDSPAPQEQLRGSLAARYRRRSTTFALRRKAPASPALPHFDPNGAADADEAADQRQPHLWERRVISARSDLLTPIEPPLHVDDQSKDLPKVTFSLAVKEKRYTAYPMSSRWLPNSRLLLEIQDCDIPLPVVLQRASDLHYSVWDSAGTELCCYTLDSENSSDDDGGALRKRSSRNAGHVRIFTPKTVVVRALNPAYTHRDILLIFKNEGHLPGRVYPTHPRIYEAIFEAAPPPMGELNRICKKYRLELLGPAVNGVIY